MRFVITFLTSLILSPLYSQEVTDKALYKLYQVGLQNESTAPNYIVIIATDDKNQITREICTEAPFLEGAIHIEYGIKYDSIGIAKVRKIVLSASDRTFKFINPNALENIGFYDYPGSSKLLEYWNSINLEEYTVYKSNDLFATIHFGSGKGDKQLMFAHLMFNNGILTGRADVTGELYFGDIVKLYRKPPE